MGRSRRSANRNRKLSFSAKKPVGRRESKDGPGSANSSPTCPGGAAREQPALLLLGPGPRSAREGRGAGARTQGVGDAPAARGRARVGLCPNAAAGGERRCRGRGGSGAAGSGQHRLRSGPEPEPLQVDEWGHRRDEGGGGTGVVETHLATLRCSRPPLAVSIPRTVPIPLYPHPPTRPFFLHLTCAESIPVSLAGPRPMQLPISCPPQHLFISLAASPPPSRTLTLFLFSFVPASPPSPALTCLPHTPLCVTPSFLFFRPQAHQPRSLPSLFWSPPHTPIPPGACLSISSLQFLSFSSPLHALSQPLPSCPLVSSSTIVHLRNRIFSPLPISWPDTHHLPFLAQPVATRPVLRPPKPAIGPSFPAWGGPGSKGPMYSLLQNPHITPFCVFDPIHGLGQRMLGVSRPL